MRETNVPSGRYYMVTKKGYTKNIGIALFSSLSAVQVVNIVFVF